MSPWSISWFLGHGGLLVASLVAIALLLVLGAGWLAVKAARYFVSWVRTRTARQVLSSRELRRRRLGSHLSDSLERAVEQRVTETHEPAPASVPAESASARYRAKREIDRASFEEACAEARRWWHASTGGICPEGPRCSGPSCWAADRCDADQEACVCLAGHEGPCVPRRNGCGPIGETLQDAGQAQREANFMRGEEGPPCPNCGMCAPCRENCPGSYKAIWQVQTEPTPLLYWESAGSVPSSGLTYTASNGTTSTTLTAGNDWSHVNCNGIRKSTHPWGWAVCYVSNYNAADCGWLCAVPPNGPMVHVYDEDKCAWNPAPEWLAKEAREALGRST